MKRLLFIILLASAICSCATWEGCRNLKRLFYEDDKTCASGYMQYEITGHAPTCADVETITEIKKICGWRF